MESHQYFSIFAKGDRKIDKVARAGSNASKTREKWPGEGEPVAVVNAKGKGLQARERVSLLLLLLLLLLRQDEPG